MANLLHIKGSRNRILNTLPSNTMGKDGDIVLSSIQGKGIYLCSKVKGKWHVSNKMEELRKIEKTSIKDLEVNRLKIGNTTITKNEYNVSSGDLTLDVGGDIELNADGGNIEFKDASVGLASLAQGLIDLYYDASNKLRISVSSAGVASLVTTGGTAADADFLVDAGGDITLDSGTGIFIAKNAGTEFSAANSAYAGMILGYTRLEGDLSAQNSYEIQDSMTVEDSTHQITFKTPPSENVEIEATVLIDVLSTDTEIHVGLSDNSTYNSIGAQFEYDTVGVWFSDDEASDKTCVVKWVLEAGQLEAVGVSNTFYIGFSTAGATKTAYVKYGLRATHGLADHPFVIKATALPATIYDGS